MVKDILTDVGGVVCDDRFVKINLLNNFLENAERITRDTDIKRRHAKLLQGLGVQNGFQTGKEVAEFLAAEIRSGHMDPDYIALIGDVNAPDYDSGKLIAPVYDDVPVALEDWKKEGRKIYTFSNGSEAEQRRMFGNTSQGDITALFDGFIDTAVAGQKNSQYSFRYARQIMGSEPFNVVFFSDTPYELHAARDEALEAVHVYRDGSVNASVTGFRTITSLLNYNGGE